MSIAIIAQGDVPESFCVKCETRLDAVTGASDEGTVPIPKPGDLTMCAKCGELMQFDENLRVRKADPEAVKQLSPRSKRFYELFKTFRLPGGRR